MRGRSRAAAAALLAAAMMAPSPAGAAVGDRTPADSIGLYDPGTSTWYLRDPVGHSVSFRFGRPGDVPLVGDWDGDGIDTPAVYRPADGYLLVRDRNDGFPVATGYRMRVGAPVVADGDGDGRDTVSIVADGRLHVLDGLGGGPAQLDVDRFPIRLPDRAEAVVGGDFDGDGTDEFAARIGARLVGLEEAAGYIDLEVDPDRMVVGDWDADGFDTPAVFDSLDATFVLFHGTAGTPDTTAVEYGSTGMIPLAGWFGPLPPGGEEPPRLVGLPELTEGDTGPAVVTLQDELARRGLYRGPIDGNYGEETAYAVNAFHKAIGAERTFDFETGDTFRLEAFELPPLPDRPDEPDRVEVDIGRQLMYVIRGGEVITIVPVSTGGSYTYFSPRNDAVVAAGTPRGDFTLFGLAYGWHCDPLTGWCIYNPWSFTEFYAMHGYRDVPAYPASHGCVRVTTWDSDELTFGDYLFVGIPFHVWDTYEPAEA